MLSKLDAVQGHDIRESWPSWNQKTTVYPPEVQQQVYPLKSYPAGPNRKGIRLPSTIFQGRAVKLPGGKNQTDKYHTHSYTEISLIWNTWLKLLNPSTSPKTRFSWINTFPFLPQKLQVRNLPCRLWLQSTLPLSGPGSPNLRMVFMEPKISYVFRVDDFKDTPSVHHPLTLGMSQEPYRDTKIPTLWMLNKRRQPPNRSMNTADLLGFSWLWMLPKSNITCLYKR